MPEAGMLNGEAIPMPEAAIEVAGEATPPPAARARVPRMGVHEAAAAAHEQAREKLDAIIARPCREDSVEAISLCTRAAALVVRAKLNPVRKGANGRKAPQITKEEQPPPAKRRASAPANPADAVLDDRLTNAVAEMGYA